MAATDPSEIAEKTAAIVVIGDEILSGRVRDANAPHLAETLSAIGVRLLEIRVVTDAHAAIVSAVQELRGRVDYLFTSGGIGPTHDDVTADAIAEVFGAHLDVRDDARAILEAYYGPDRLNPARLRMARVPDGATLINNPVSRAPGFRMENVFVLAGVPMIFREMLAEIAPQLQGGPPMLSWSLRAPTPEGDIAAGIGAIDAAHDGVSVGVYPFYVGGLGATIVLRGRDRGALSAAADQVRDLLRAAAAEGAAIDEFPPASSA